MISGELQTGGRGGPGALPAPDDPAPRGSTLTLDLDEGAAVAVRDDRYSERLRCDHPSVRDAQALGRALIRLAERRGRPRVVVLCRERLRAGLAAAGLVIEATVPGFYQGEEACAIMGAALHPERAEPVDAEALAAVERLLARRPPARTDRAPVETSRATAGDGPAIARLLARTFDAYPTPSGVPEYIVAQIREGIPFRIVRERGREERILACASADLVRQARTAELTDCATRPEARGRGLMQAILGDLLGDLRRLGYPTAFTLARAIQPGVNLAFQRLGFAWCGRMIRSCRIGSGIEDMNVWARRLVD